MTKISLIGAGSGCFSIGLVRDLCASPHLGGSTISLMDINRERLDAIYDLCIRYRDEIGGSVKVEKTTDRIESLKGADYVITTALTVPYKHLKEGWDIADKYGFDFPGSIHIKHDEAFWSNFYQFRLFESLTQDILEHCPKAWHLLVANPVISGTTYIQRKYPEAKIVGLCHGYGNAYKIAESLGFENREEVAFQLSGPNHFVWLHGGKLKDQDYLAVLDEALQDETIMNDPKRCPIGKIQADFYRRHGVIGIGDTLHWTGGCWPWFYRADEETKREFDDTDPMDGWNGYFKWVAETVADIEALSKDPSRSVKEFMETVWTDDLMVPLVESLACDIPRKGYVNMLNKGGVVEGVPEDFSVEVLAEFSKDSITPIKAKPLPRAIRAYILRDRVAPVEMELEAFRTGKMAYLEELVLMDKWATSLPQVRGFIKEILDMPCNAEMKAHFTK